MAPCRISHRPVRNYFGHFIAGRKCCSVLLRRSWEAGEGMTKSLRTIENEGYCLVGFNAFILQTQVFQSKYNCII